MVKTTERIHSIEKELSQYVTREKEERERVCGLPNKDNFGQSERRRERRESYGACDSDSRWPKLLPGSVTLSVEAKPNLLPQNWEKKTRVKKGILIRTCQTESNTPLAKCLLIGYHRKV